MTELGVAGWAFLIAFMVFPLAGFVVLDRLGRVPRRQRASGFVTAVLATVLLGVAMTMTLWGWDIGEAGSWALAIAWTAVAAAALWLVRRLDP